MPSTNFIPPDANGNITLSTLVEAIADDYEIGKTSEYFPTSGRVVKDSEDGTIYLADGTSWNDVSSAIGIDSPRTQTDELRSETPDGEGYVISDQRPSGRIDLVNPPSIFNRSNGVIAFEADDGLTETYTEAFPRHRDRGLPWGVALDPNAVGNSTHVSWAELQEIAAHGGEIATHTEGIPGQADANLTTADKEDVINALYERRRLLENKGLRVNRVVPAGTPDFEDRTDLEDTFGGRAAMAGYSSVRGVKSAFDGGTSSAGYGGGGGLEDSAQQMGPMAKSDVDDVIDAVADSGAALTLYYHPQSIGDSGKLTWSEVDAILDKVETMRNAGDLNVVTPTLSRYMAANQRELNINPYPSFETTNAVLKDYIVPQHWHRSNTNVVVNTTTSRTGSNSLEIPAPEEARFRFNIPSGITNWGVELWARTKATGVNATLEVWGTNSAAWSDYNPDFDIVERQFSSGVNDTWSQYTAAFGKPRHRNGSKLTLRVSANDILIDDVYIYPL